MSSEKTNILEIEDLKKVVKIFTSNWYWFVLFPAISYAIAYFYTHRLTDIYAAQTQILLKSDEVFRYSQGGKTDIYSSFENTSSQMRVLKSSDLIEKAIAKMDIDVSYYIIGRVKVSEVYKNMPFKVVSENFGSSAIGKEFRINLINMHKFRLKYFNEEDEEISKEYGFGEIILDNGFYFTINRNQNLNENSVPYLSKINYMFRINSRSHIVQKFSRNLSVKNLEWTSILEATVEDEIPDRAITFLDTLAAVFIDNTLQSKINISVNTINYIDRQLEEISGIIREIEDEMERFKNAKEITNLSREEEESYKKLTELENNKLHLDLKIKSINELREYVLNSSDEKFLPPSFFILDEDGFLKNSVNKLYDLQISKNEFLFKGTEKSAPARQIDSTFEGLRKDILLYMLNSQNFIEKNLQTISAEINFYEEKIKNFPKTQRQIANIERKLNINQSLYQFLLQKRAETVIARAGIVPETKVIERARSIGIVKPDKQKITGTFMSIALGLALLVSLIRFFFFEKYENIAELSKSTKLPVIGGLPLSEKASENYIVLDSEPKSTIAEAFRTIRTNLQYLSPGKKSNVILITSLHPEEGKTFCSANLAVIIAKANKKVLLVDMDLHRPKIHKAMQAAGTTIGMSNYLIGKQSFAEAKIISPYENLEVVFSGPTPPNASELILSETIPGFFEKAKQEYDCIIIDTPPLGLINDAIVLINHADVVLFVMNTKFANKQGLNFLEEVANKTKKSCAIVLNKIKSRKWKYYYGGYRYNYYNYGYGYGYGYGAKEKG